jgi:hypothetical protein
MGVYRPFLPRNGISENTLTRTECSSVHSEPQEAAVPKRTLRKDGRPVPPESIRGRRKSAAEGDVSTVFDLGRSDGADISRAKDALVGRSAAAAFPRKRSVGKSTR